VIHKQQATMAAQQQLDTSNSNTNTYLVSSAMWYHDAADAAAETPLYGVCMDCGIGLDDANDFFYDRREKQCDCFTCNACFEHFFGKDQLFKSANWKTLGIQAPQYIRVSW